jgi:hypothetical protein
MQAILEPFRLGNVFAVVRQQMSRKPSSQTARLLGAALAVLLASTAARADDDISGADLQVAARAIGFLDNLPHDGTFVVGIVYSDSANAREDAVQTANRLGSMQGPAKTKFRTLAVAAKDLATAAGRLDFVILLPNQSAGAKEIADAVRHRHIISISTDPDCLVTQCCVLMVRAGSSVDIVLDTALAAAVGAQFSPVFAMIVKRQ